MKKLKSFKIGDVKVIVNVITGKTAALVLPVGMNGEQLKEWRRLTCTPAQKVWF